MKIAQVAPLFESVPPKLYGGTERVVSYVTEELVAQGHDVTLFASGDSETAATLVPCSRAALRLDPAIEDGLPYHISMLDQVMHEVQIEADPSDIPNHIDVDVSAMQIATVLHVGDLQLPQGVTALDDAGLTVCTVQAPRVAEETVAEPTGDEPEVIRAKKTEEGAA